jgi:uncharacterized integral membrane protein (TIGR00697 family)
MKRLFLTLSFLMGLVVLASNYLVQFPFKYYGLEEILTYGAFSYPIAFLITDLANRSYGKIVARKIVYIGFIIGIAFTLFFSTNLLVLTESLDHIYAVLIFLTKVNASSCNLA